jgi:hypothetical protein
MIDLSQGLLLEWLLSSFLCGGALGLLYSMIGAVKMLCGIYYTDIRPFKKHMIRVIFEYAVTFVFDLLFWICVGVLSILLIYQMGGGFFRGMTYIGMAAGFGLYYFTLGKLLIPIIEKNVKAVKKLLYKVLRLLLFPIKKIISAIIALYRLTIGRILGKIKESMTLRKSAAKSAEAEASPKGSESGGEEEFVYVDGKNGYRKSGRISFNTNRK